MQISEALQVFHMEKALARTPWGRPMNEYAVQVIEAAISDEKNHNSDVAQCLGCGLAMSSLTTSDGCPNCGVLDLTLDVESLIPKKAVENKEIP